MVILDQSQSSLRNFWEIAQIAILPVWRRLPCRVDLSFMPNNFGTFHILPTGLHGLCFGFCFCRSAPSTFPVNGPLSRVHFGESLVVRLHSEIDHIHLSSEAQCVSHILPQVDCHRDNTTYISTIYRVTVRVSGKQ